jgi:hypothetical protein
VGTASRAIKRRPQTYWRLISSLTSCLNSAD